MRCRWAGGSKRLHEHSYIIYLILGFVALVRDHEIWRFEVEASTVSNLANQSHWLESIKPSLEPVAKRSCRLQSLRREPVAIVANQAQAEYARSRPSSHAASQEHSIPESSRSQEHDSQSHETSLWDSSVADISVPPTSTNDNSTRASSSLVTPNSVGSSAVISGASSILPAYSERGSAAQSQRHSAEYESVSLPERVYLRNEPDTHSTDCRP